MCDVQIDQLKYGGVLVTRRLPDGTSEVKKYDDYDEEFIRLYGWSVFHSTVKHILGGMAW